MSIFKTLKSLLEAPEVFRFFSAIVGTQKAFKNIVDEMGLQKNARVLDIGCGFGGLLEQVSEVDYLGFDSNSDYINYAARRYKNRGQFVCNTVNAETLEGQEPFDFVLAYGVVHHLDDVEAKKLFQLAYSALKKDGVFLCVDPVLYQNQSSWKRWLASNDRGEFVRTQNEYQSLAHCAFSSVEAKIVENWIHIPASLLVMKAQKV